MTVAVLLAISGRARARPRRAAGGVRTDRGLRGAVPRPSTTDTTPPSAPSNFSVGDYEQALGYGCTQQTIINGADSGSSNDILGNQISGGVLSQTVFLPVGTDTIDVVAIDPAGLVSAASNSFTGNFIAGC